MKSIKGVFITGVLVFFLLHAHSQHSISGRITDSGGTPLPWATVYVEELKYGTISNLSGEFLFPVVPGKYTLTFRHLGYQTLTQLVETGKGTMSLNIVLHPMVVTLPVVSISSSAEDPAYAYMRKAIAAARYYRMLVKSYEATIYIKGSGEIRIPGILRAMAGEQPVDSVEYILSETVSRNYFEYPNTQRQEVLSARTNDKDTGQVMINRFTSANIYDPMFGEVVSPLSPSAFGFYRFRLKNSFTDGIHEIHHIAVIPRSRGAGVFEGDIYLVDGLWSVYRFHLSTWTQGFELSIHQEFAPVGEKVWFPVSHRYDLKGKILGIRFDFQYLASLSDYLVKTNDTLAFDRLVLIDEKTEKEYAMAVEAEKELQNQGKAGSADSTLPQKFTLKDFRRMVKEMEKETARKQKEPEVIADYSMKIDSSAFRRDASFWDSLRPIPLTASEKRPGLGRKIDSVENLKKSDTLRPHNRLGRTAGMLLTGGQRSLGRKWWFESDSPLEQLNFNTVEGLTGVLPLRFVRRERDRLKAATDLRYGFARKSLFVRGSLAYTFQYQAWESNHVEIQGGNYIFQLNPDNPVHPFLNTFYSLFWMDNYLKLYTKKYFLAKGTIQVTSKLVVTAEVEGARREMPENVTDYTWASRKGRNYTPNTPYNIEIENTGFDPHDVRRAQLGLSWKPGLKFRRDNGRLQPVRMDAPELSLMYSGAWQILGGDIHWNRLEAQIKGNRSGPRGSLAFRITGGNTFHKGDIPFADFYHFNGNRTFISLKGPLDAYRLLDYYRFSTQEAWAGALFHMTFNRLLVSRIFWLNIMGVRESIGVNYLRTSHSPNYWEAGYGIENLFRFLRIELYTAWEDAEYKEFGVRLGLSVGNSVTIGN